MVADAPTKEALEGQKAKYMAALNITVPSVPAWEYVLILTDAKARTGKRAEGGRGVGSKEFGAYGRDVLNENGKLLLGFAEDNKLAILNTFYFTPKSGVSYTFQRANRSKGQTRLDYIITKQADCQVIRCVEVRQSPLEAPESDHNLVYAKSTSNAGPHQTGGRGTEPSKLRRRPTSGGSCLTRTFDTRFQRR